MSRSTFGGPDTGALAIQAPGATGGVLRSAPNITGGTAWSASTGGTQYTDLIVPGGGATTVCTDANGYVIAFQGPDGINEGLWVNLGSGTRFYLRTTDGLNATYGRGRVNTPRMRRKFSLPFDNATALPASLMGTGAPSTAWTMTGGVITPPAGEADWRVALARDAVFANGVARVTMTNAGGVLGGITLSREGGARYLIFALTAAAPVAFGVFTYEGGTFNVIVNNVALTDVDTSFTAPPVMTLEMERKGTGIKFRVNGRLVYTHTDIGVLDAHHNYTPAGQVGLIAKPGEQPTFRDFTVTEYLDPRITPQLTKIHVTGTSISNGVGATDSAHMFRNVLAASLGTGYTGGTVTASNGGVNGQKSDGMFAALAADLATYTPQVCIIETPCNDAQATVGLTAFQTKTYLRGMVALCRQAGVIPVMWTAGPFNKAQMDISLGANDYTLASHCKLADANNLARKVAADEGVILADVQHAYNSDSSSTLLNDGLHPNNTGHALIASTIFDAMTGAGLI